jgi:hypothetical protein
MENVVPGALRRLRAADIIRMAGLTAASLGQEYCRTGAVHSTQRQDVRLIGIVDISHTTNGFSASSLDSGDDLNTVPQIETNRRHYSVEVEIQNSVSWMSTCSCSVNTATPSLLCAHAAALLYQWLARPASFISIADGAAGQVNVGVASAVVEEQKQAVGSEAGEPERPSGAAKPVRPLVSPRGPSPLGSLTDILTQLGLSDLRGIAREYEIITNGMSKQQLAEAVVAALGQPETVRRVAATLEKSQRQLLAAIVLAGGSVNDDDLRGIYERFALGQPAQLQGVLVALQNKAMLFRANMNSTAQQRIGLSGALLDVGWFVPVEVRSALRVMVPVTSFNVYSDEFSEKEAPVLQERGAFNLLTDLLLIARTLDGYRVEKDDEWLERGASGSAGRSTDTPFSIRISGSYAATADGSVAMPPPADTPPESLIAAVQAVVPRSTTFLRFAVRLLRLADILHKDDGGGPYLRVLPNAAQLLLGPGCADVVRDLFELWLTQSSYEDLFALREDGVRLRCRATSLNVPVMRAGELEAENSEARQSVLALLAQVPLNQWVSFQGFARFMYRLVPLFLQKRQRLFSSPHWWLEVEEGRPLRPLTRGEWLQAESRYLARLLSGPLHWWGICDIAATQNGQLLAFRLTDMAAWLFNNQAIEEEASVQNYHDLIESLDIVDSEEMLVTCSSRAWPLIEIMETFTEAAGVKQNRLCYRLTPKVLGKALSHGHHPAQFLELLRHRAEHTSQPTAAQTQMLDQLERWIASYGRARLYTGVTLLETADSMVMRELVATTSLDQQIVQPIHPTLLILKKTGTERIIDDLKRRGQPPLLHDEEMYGAE